MSGGLSETKRRRHQGRSQQEEAGPIVAASRQATLSPTCRERKETVQPLPSAVRELLDRPVSAVVSTVGADGLPQASVVWIERDGEDIAFFSDATSNKIVNLAQRPAVIAIVIDHTREFEPGAPCYVRLTGTARISPLADSSFPDRLARRYMGLDAFPHHGDYVRVDVTTSYWSGVGPFADTRHGWGE